ncbi:MAG: hypothetical protein AAF788_06720 [Pseudomonadota bacterium]
MAHNNQQTQTLDKEALRRLIETTIAAVGETDPGALPHVIRRRLEGQATGEADLDQTISEILKDLRKG